MPALHRPFDYRLPPAMDGAVEIGTEVRVVLHGRRVRAWVTALDVEPPPGVDLRPVAAVRSVGPPASLLSLAEWAAWRWAGPVVSFLRTASAPKVVRHLPPTAPSPPALSAPAPAGARSGHHDVHRGDDLGSAGGVDLTAAMAGGTAVVRVGPATDRRPLLLAAAQRLVDRSVPAGAGVLVLVPEAEDVPRAAAQLRGAGVPVAVLPEGWARARAGGCVVVGTRAAAWAPLPRLAAAVVLDAHDGALVEQRAPTWSAWQVVAERARRDGAPCLLVSPCPTLELLQAGRLRTGTRMEERRGWPPVEVVDLRSGDPRHGLLSPRVAELGRWAVAAPGRRVVMVVNRTGGVRLLACAACGEVARCGTCHGPLELADELAPPCLRCRRCGAERPVVCGRCGSTATRALRLGVRRLRHDLQALVGAPVLELTAASRHGGAARAGGPPGALAAGAEGEVGGAAVADVGRADGVQGPARVVEEDAALVVGTEAALRGGAPVDAVVMLDFDGELLAPRLRAGEEALALLARAARALRRSQLPTTPGRAPGRLVVQTRQPTHPVVRAAVTGDPAVLADEEMAVRATLGLPPVTALARLSGPGAHDLAEALRHADAGAPVPPGAVPVGGVPVGGVPVGGVPVGGPWVDGPVDGVWTVRAADSAALSATLASVPRPAERVRVEVDPVQL